MSALSFSPVAGDAGELAKQRERDFVSELQAVMETLDDLDLLHSSEIVRAARDEIAALNLAAPRSVAEDLAVHGAEATLQQLRADGWSVAVHNDYRLSGEAKTFWLLTHASGRWIKGEGATDNEALQFALAQALSIPEFDRARSVLEVERLIRRHNNTEDAAAAVVALFRKNDGAKP